MRTAGRYKQTLADPTQKVRKVSKISGTTKAISLEIFDKTTRQSQICNDQQQN